MLLVWFAVMYSIIRGVASTIPPQTCFHCVSCFMSLAFNFWWWLVRSVMQAPPQENVVENVVNELVAELGEEFGDNLAEMILAANGEQALPEQRHDDRTEREAKECELGHVRNKQQEAKFQRLEKKRKDVVEVFTSDDSIPNNLRCPISYEAMIDPVMTPAGHCYQRVALKGWIDKKGTCPITFKSIADKPLYPNIGLANQVEEWMDDFLKKKRKSHENDDIGSSGRQKAQRIDTD